MLLASLADRAVESSIAASGRSHSPGFPIAASQGGNQLVYADFETVKDNRPWSSRGGWIQLTVSSVRPTLPSHVKGQEGVNPPAPELVKIKKDDPNRAMAFDFDMQGLNQWADAAVEVHGQPDKDGKPVPDDVSGYQFLSMQIYVTGVTSLRVEFISKGNGVESNGYPQMPFKVSTGFNTYRIPLKGLSQPSWAEPRVNPKDVLKKLTMVKLSAYCNECLTVKGTLVVDNMIFTN
jgi:hypothetical protein